MAESLAHTKWLCKYHIVFTPKYRRKIIYNQLREDIKGIIKDLCKWKGKESFKLAKEMGYTSVILVGDPAFYHRFGFKAAANFGIKHTQNIPDENVMACELVPDALCGISGIIECC